MLHLEERRLGSWYLAARTNKLDTVRPGPAGSSEEALHWPDGLEPIAALQQLTAQSSQRARPYQLLAVKLPQLQYFALKGGVQTAGILHNLPTSLTRLDLDLSGSSDPAVVWQHHLAPIAKLQRLTELSLGVVDHYQLLAVKLPRLLQQLDVTVDLDSCRWALLGVVEWLRLHGHIVRCLRLSNLAFFGIESADITWGKAMEALAEGLQSAQQTAAAIATAAGSAEAAAANSTTKATPATLHNASTAGSCSWRMHTLHCHPAQLDAVPLPGLLLKLCFLQ